MNIARNLAHWIYTFKLRSWVPRTGKIHSMTRSKMNPRNNLTISRNDEGRSALILGIELVPDISVTFRVNTGFPLRGEPGSRFGYRTGTTPDAKLLQSQDQDVIT